MAAGPVAPYRALQHGCRHGATGCESHKLGVTHSVTSSMMIISQFSNEVFIVTCMASTSNHDPLLFALLAGMVAAVTTPTLHSPLRS